MRIALRSLAIAIAVAGVVDPAIARRVAAPLALELRLPAASHPDFGRAQALRDAVVRSLDPRVWVDGRTAPHAIVALGDADLGDVGGARVFAMPLPVSRPSVSIDSVHVPRRMAVGQAGLVDATLMGIGAAGRTSTIDLVLDGAVLASRQHEWTADGERVDVNLGFAPPGQGVHRARVRVTTEGADESVADALVVARGEPVRILVYESRPSWPVTFVRRSLEADALFEVASTVTSSRSVQTMTPGAPSALGNLEVDRYDALVVGALEEFRDADLSALDRFVSERGGTLILLPDRQVPERIGRRLGLPELDEVLLADEVEVKGSGVSFKASELLLMESPAAEAIATVRQGKTDRIVIAALGRGAGRIVLSGALDAWRYRAPATSAFDASWKGLIADGALQAPPRIDVHAEPAIARTGETVKISVNVRGTELEREPKTVSLPPVSAWVSGEDGRKDAIRLWPVAPVGRLEATVVTSAPGHFTITASIPGATTTIPLMIADDVVQTKRGESRAPAQAAKATGGAIVNDPGELGRALQAIDTGSHDETSRPMRSPWWIVPFALALCGEWTLRRRAGWK